MLFTPEATLFDSVDGKQVTTHFFSVNPNPSDGGKIRATWQHSKDTSTVLRVPVERDHGFRWKMITQSGGT
jgi:hypothetical protein